MKEEKNKPKHFNYFNFFLILLLVVMLNSLFLPSINSRIYEEVDYSTFLTQVESDKVDQVEMSDTQIVYTLKKSGENEKKNKKSYYTGYVENPDLVKTLQDHNVKFTKQVTDENSWIVNFIVSWILPLAIFLFIGNWLMKSMAKRLGGGANAMQFGKSNAKVYVEAQTGKTFDDVAGQDEAKEALTEIVDFLHNPKKYEEIGAVMPKGALLVGPPGTGKTLLAKAVAGEAKVPFFSISGSEFVEMFVGMGAAKVRDLFKQANEKAPCIVFIDEIDTIGKKRDTGMPGGNDEREQTLNQLLTEMDGFDGKKGVVILAATNRPDSLDKALLRPGRFDRRIPVELPDLAGRESILKVHAHGVNMAKDIDYNAIARATAGASGAELANIINEGALRAVKMGRHQVLQEDLEESVEVVIAGYQRKGAVISQREKSIIAYHEVGHALVAAKQTESAPVHKITIIPRTSGALGYTMQVDEGEKVLMTKQEAFNKIATFTGGRAAEELIFGSFTTGASNDIEQATKMARAMVTRYGMSEDFDMMALETVTNQYLGGDASLTCSPETSTKIDQEVLSIIKSAHKKAMNILKENEEKLHEISKYLLERETITGEEFMEILNGEKPSDKIEENTDSDNTSDQDEVVLEGSEFQTVDEGLTLEKKIDVKIDKKLDLDKDNK
ncbi:MAG: ATP-dependent zinc metalloprotease FtsH [Clostridium sp.]|uniref:ATP-dependent zinc metalloprotease FtsH n=1 Tax=Clostridium sp. 2218st1_F5_2218SCRN_220325 TaxID=3143056 RepID=UPI00319DFD9B